MNLENFIETSGPEEKLTKKDWREFNKEVKKCKDCKKSIKQPEDYCNYHQEIYSDMTGSVI